MRGSVLRHACMCQRVCRHETAKRTDTLCSEGFSAGVQECNKCRWCFIKMLITSSWQQPLPWQATDPWVARTWCTICRPWDHQQTGQSTTTSDSPRICIQQLVIEWCPNLACTIECVSRICVLWTISSVATITVPCTIAQIKLLDLTAQHTTCVIHNILIITCHFGHILPFSSYDAQQKSYPVTKAGPSALAGLMHIELTGPRIHMSRQIAKGTAKGPNFPQPLQTGSFSDIQCHVQDMPLVHRILIQCSA